MKKYFVLLWISVAAMGISSAATVEDLRTPDVTGLNVSDQEMEALRFL